MGAPPHELGPARDDFDFDQLRSGFGIETLHFLYSRRLDHEPIPGAGLVVPLRFFETPFEMTPDEAVDLVLILGKARSHIEEEFQPDGYTVGWNCYYDAGQRVRRAHLHLIPRFADEPQAGLGIRYWLRTNNSRTEPLSAGSGRALASTYWP